MLLGVINLSPCFTCIKFLKEGSLSLHASRTRNHHCPLKKLGLQDCLMTQQDVIGPPMLESAFWTLLDHLQLGLPTENILNSTCLLVEKNRLTTLQSIRQLTCNMKTCNSG
ncbi:hypothetical protein CEXT_538381 [Caerostris extrusa]|uniref:Uncharacterized protein n=1 Tax=Caerostris extrusa TaxID=172846 RepID=A0AAV4SCE6_CAEEX|nr:hypothetical protein CEXT_538381 [Caerostris extrusa]